jgi:hypothetical protein
MYLQFEENLQSLIDWAQVALTNTEPLTIYLIKFEGSYVSTLDLSRFNSADGEDDSYQIGAIQKAKHFNKNDSLRAKYFLDFHHNCTYEIVDFRNELIGCLDQKKQLLEVVKNS